MFDEIKQNPKKFISKEQFSFDKHRSISDFISGMTDRYAIKLYNNILHFLYPKKNIKNEEKIDKEWNDIINEMREYSFNSGDY